MIWLSSMTTVDETAAAPIILVDHYAVDVAQIPLEWLNAARSLDTFFAHKSVGDNILDGMVDLQAQNPTRYNIDIAVDGPDWFVTHSGILHQSLGSNTLPQTKIDGFDDYIRGGYHTANVAMMKFCPSDTLPFGTMPANDIWIGYRDMMAALEQAYPDVVFVWWTMPLSIASDDRGNDEKEIFNGLVRQYCDMNGCVLFDIADIESHDPSGNPVISPAGYEAMWAGYASDGAHLNETGRQRVASAFWWLFARIAGWDSPPGFRLEVMPDVAIVEAGGTAVYHVTVLGSGGFTQSVQLDAEGPAIETAVFWSHNPILPGQTSTMTIAVDTAVPIGNYSFNIVGTAGTFSDIIAPTLQVRRLMYMPVIFH
jgi:hypothetical protein